MKIYLEWTIIRWSICFLPYSVTTSVKCLCVSLLFNASCKLDAMNNSVTKSNIITILPYNGIFLFWINSFIHYLLKTCVLLVIPKKQIPQSIYFRQKSFKKITSLSNPFLSGIIRFHSEMKHLHILKGFFWEMGCCQFWSCPESSVSSVSVISFCPVLKQH